MNGLDKAIVACLVLLFLFAGIDKLAHIGGFIKAINSYSLLPMPLGSVLAPIIIAVEISIAVGLLRSSWRHLAALAGAVLMTVFTVGLLGNKILGADGICGCWFSISMAQGNLHFALNAMLVAMFLFVWHASSGAERAKAEAH